MPKASDALLAAGDEQSLRDAIELDPARADVRVQLARILLADGREAEALELLRPVEHDREADGLLARSELAADPDAPPVARLGLEALARGEHEAGLRALLEAIAETSGDTRDRIRRVDDRDVRRARRRRPAGDRHSQAARGLALLGEDLRKLGG